MRRQSDDIRGRFGNSASGPALKSFSVDSFQDVVAVVASRPTRDSPTFNDLSHGCEPLMGRRSCLSGSARGTPGLLPLSRTQSARGATRRRATTSWLCRTDRGRRAGTRRRRTTSPPRWRGETREHRSWLARGRLVWARVRSAGRRSRWAHRPRGDRHRAGRLRPRKPYVGTLADGHLMLDDPQVVIQGDRGAPFALSGPSGIAISRTVDQSDTSLCW